MKTAIFIVLAVAVLFVSADNAIQRNEMPSSSKDAFVTMLYTIQGDMYVDGFEIGVRVLGQSLRESKTQYDYIVLCTDDVPRKVKRVLKDDGWIVKPLDKLHLSDRFNENAYKLNVFKLTDYRRIVFIDADAIVVKNVDELFKCGTFCASFRHSDLFNSGVMVIQPSLTELNNMVKSMSNFSGAAWTHRTFGDQVILNHHFGNLKKARMFEPNTKDYDDKPMRLASGYNADIGMYYLDGHWAIPFNDLKIIHYTLGIVKPMLWWTYPLFDLNWKWDDLRGRLPSKFNEPSIFAFQHWLPAIALIMLFVSFRVCSSTYKWVYRHKLIIKMNLLLVPGSCGWCVVFSPIVFQTFSYFFASYSIPSIMRPKQAWWLFGMWTMFYMTVFYSLYCRFLVEAGDSFGTRFITVQAARLESVMHGTLFLFFFLMLFYIPYLMSAFHTRVIVFLILVAVCYIQGYISGRRVLKIWFGHNTKTTTVLPCYRLGSPKSTHSAGKVDF